MVMRLCAFLALVTAVFSTGCVSTASESRRSRVAKAAPTAAQVVDKLDDYSFGTQSDYDSPLYSEGRKNRFSLTFD